MRVGIDIGGTFTDLVAVTDDGIEVAKVASTPDDPSRAFAEALSRLDGHPEELMHGTTVATNAVLTRSGARLAFLATEGFRHLLLLGRQDRPSLYDLAASRTAPLVGADACIGVTERIGPDGEVLTPLDEEALRSVLRGLDVDGVAVCLLHAYANPAHERRVAEVVGEVVPEATVSVSSQVVAEFREYERASTTALNAYVQPVLSRYLGRIRDEAAGARVGVMWSGGGVRGIDATIDLPVHTLLSGPAAGVLAATWVGERCGVADLVTIDMGGTSADVAIVDGGRPSLTTSTTLDGLPFQTPCMDVVSVGAGGGSIGWVDEGGALRVGPRSAGADPGPACYGLGGDEATVTDAQVVLGYLAGEGLAGGELPLEAEAAETVVARLGERCGLDVTSTAEGILRVVRATMSRAIRSVSVERGKDVREYTLVAFGGAGPLHATALARDLGMPRVIVPPAPGTLAALGLLVARRRSDASVSHPMRADRSKDAELRPILSRLTEQVLSELAAEGVPTAKADVELWVDMRYEGQSHELRVAVDGGPSFTLLTEAFERAHDERYGFCRPGVAVEAVTFRAVALGPHAPPTLPSVPDGRGEQVGETSIAGQEVAVFRRADLGRGQRIDGPALVTELDSTTWIDASSVAKVHDSGTLVLEMGGAPGGGTPVLRRANPWSG